MQSTSNLWRRLWASGKAWLETVAVIEGREYSAITSPVINRSLMQNGLSVGNTVSATCTFSLRTDDEIPRSAQVVVNMRLTDGTSVSEWIPAGTFFISHRTRDAVTGLLTLECYDALLKGNADFVPTGTWPKSMIEVCWDIEAALGVSIDQRTDFVANEDMDEPEAGTTINDMLRAIGMANGGNWVITPAGNLRMVRLISAAEAEYAWESAEVAGVTGSIATSTSGTITGVRCRTEEGEAFLAGDESGLVIDVEASVPVVLDLADWMVGITYQAFDMKGAIYDPAIELGDFVNRLDDVHSVLYCENATLGLAFRGDVSAPEPGELADEYPYIGKNARTLQVAKAYAKQCVDDLDESLTQEDIFNRLTDNGTVQGLYMADEQLYINASYIDSGYLSADRIEADSIAVEKLTGAISGGVEDSWELNLTDGTFTIGEIDADSITTGTLDADRIETHSIAVGKLVGTIWGGMNDRSYIDFTNGTLHIAEIDAGTITAGTLDADRISSHTITVDKLTGYITDTTGDGWALDLANGTFTIGSISANDITSGTISADMISGGTLTLGGSNNTNGTLMVKDASGNTIGTWTKDGVTAEQGTIGSFTLDNGELKYGSTTASGTGARIGTGGISYNSVSSSTNESLKTEMSSTALSFYREDALKAWINLSSQGLQIGCNDRNDNATFPIAIWNYYASGNDITQIGLGYTTRVTGQLSATGLVEAYTNMRVYNDLTVNGTKSRRVSTGQYSDRLLYCYETPSPLFGDVGEGVIGEDGRCYVWLDAVFAETVTTTQYQVFLQKYGAGDCYVSERKGAYFLVEGTPGLAFGWEMKAKQRDFDQRRLERADDGELPETTDYGALASKHIQEIQKEREMAA